MVAELHAPSTVVAVSDSPYVVTAPVPLTVPAQPVPQDADIIVTDHLDFAYGQRPALMDVSLTAPKNAVTAFIGPSGCGKSTLLRCFNRLNDRIPSAHITGGAVRIMGKNIHDSDVDLISLRRQVGMIFQKYNPFPRVSAKTSSIPCASRASPRKTNSTRPANAPSNPLPSGTK